ncbi:hypothetical protein CWI42_012380 [Ordospora colligata]|uniref:Uncharacterized protein n=1 Tax=Ordospora colligata OC4 TaxID=1354746 RepID=A0A0B2UNC9_9MICR|nr:uncharacterized protein M896_012380 [Ordospora colligata OC4]KHN70582.1 hypothetical protein M896_012380 [Ordospora colligata OC4]TBU17332.1 hypothetical protein CWI41_012380 [Ordospora colligata]TBU17582.1 hypothetical protein CWI40_012380 [Ordospora colligata]TBU19762.1 hypothetical protein CWI42_012380 [Ordospora colligata]
MEGVLCQSGKVFSDAYRIMGASPLVPVFLSLTYLTRNISSEYYAYSVIASGILLGLSIYVVGYVKEKRNEEQVSTLGDMSRGVSKMLSDAAEAIVVLSKYIVLLITVDVFINTLFVRFPFMEEIRSSISIYRVLFGLGLALVSLMIYVMSTFFRKTFLAVSAAAMLVMAIMLGVCYLLGVNSAFHRQDSAKDDSLSSFFWITAIALYTMEFVSGGVKVVNESRHRELNKYVAIASASMVSAILLIFVYAAEWMRSTNNSLDILKLVFLKSSKLNNYLKEHTIDKYCITSSIMCICIPVACVAIFAIQFDVFIRSFKKLVNAENDNKILLLSLAVLGMIFIQVLFNEVFGTFHFYLALVVVGITPLLAYHPYICYIVTSKKITLFTAVSVLAIIFICGVLVGTTKTLIDMAQIS